MNLFRIWMDMGYPKLNMAIHEGIATLTIFYGMA
jgi:hypothetical protein